MDEHMLPTDAGHTDLGDGYMLHTNNLPGKLKVDSADGSRTIAADTLDALLKNSGLRLDKVIVLPPASSSGAREFTGGAPPPPNATLDVEVGDDESCVLLVEDESSGALSWVIPDIAREGREAAGPRGLARTLRFTLPLASIAQAQGARGFRDLSDLGKKIKSYFFKVTDELLGPIIHGFAKKWETKHRPTFTRTFGPDDYQNDDPNFPPLNEAGWRRLSQGRALLFVHGTFSTSGAFGPLEPSAIAEFSRRYGGRMFAFNHPTMTADPRENAIAFLSDIPASVKLEIDIVCHSRGGLVARQIAALGEVAGSVAVRRIVFVGATNAGTALADDDHMVEMIDRFTTIAKFIPEGTVKKIVDALVLVVKVIGHGFLHDLEGLSAMNPSGEFLRTLNVPSGAAPDFFAIASDFEPKPDTPFLSLTRVEDLAVDRVFDDAANDLVVPRDGVFSKNGAGGFPIADARCLKYGPADAIIHTEFFSEPRTGAKLLEWLEPLSTGARGLTDGPSVSEIARALDAMRDHALATLTSGGRARELGPSFTPGDLEALRPHVVNLSEGEFKQSGIFSTTPGDVDAIVREHIPKWAANQPPEQPLRIVIWAHGGLVGERDGLRIAQKHVEWWKKNGVYPIYVVWETGLFDALRSILESVARKIPGLGTRDIFDFTTDPLVQEGVRALGGVHVWGAMKSYAELASGANGGARFVAGRLAALAKNAAVMANRPLEFHAVGHSAGAIFHSWFLPTAREAQVPTFKTLQLLAPAITIAEFEARLAGHFGPGATAERAMMYTMNKHFEEDDDCIGIYRKSLLYLIHHGLETERRTPILGLEISIRAAVAVATLFGLNGATGAPGRVVWSVTDGADGRSSSRSTRHGDFDDDPLTMNSVAANVLNEAQARVPYQGGGGSRGVDGWPIADEWLEGVDLSSVGSGPRLGGGGGASLLRITAGAESGGGSPGGSAPSPASRPKAPRRPAGTGGARRALCVGIDDYPSPNTLTGCYNDTRIWGNALAAAKFDVTPLTNKDATRAAIVAALSALVTTSKPGDVLVFQYSGHGTQVPDTDGDEDDGEDEALVPVDFDGGAFLVDDDIRVLLNLLPQGVNLTAFIDCCHSGTITRMLGRNSLDTDMTGARFLKRTRDWQGWMQAHYRFREHVNNTGSVAPIARGLVDNNALRWVDFSACDATEVALEHNGNGDFSLNATRLLSGDLSRFTHRSFQDQVVTVFGEKRRQTPQLDCPDAFKDLPLLQPLN
jgi:hypothetical protein